MNTYIGKSEFGRGVFAGQEIESGEIIEECPVLTYDNSQELTPDDHSFEWDDNSWCIVLGNGSIYNHNPRPNAQFVRNYANKTMMFVSLCRIHEGEEIMTNYHGDIYCTEPLWFHGEEKTEQGCEAPITRIIRSENNSVQQLQPSVASSCQ